MLALLTLQGCTGPDPASRYQEDPEAVARGLRRSTDMVGGVLERTRGDLTVALRQRRLEEKLADFREDLHSTNADEAEPASP